MNLRKSILALSVVAGIVAAPMTVFAAHTHSWGSPQYYGYEDEMPGIYDDWDKCATRHVYNYKQCLICGEVSIYEVETIEMSHKWVNGACVYCNKGYAKDNMKGEINAKKTTFCISTNYFMLFIRM